MKETIQKLPSTYFLKKQQQKKLRLRVLAYSLGEYLYIFTKNGVTLKHRTYAINETDKYLLE